MTLMNRRRLVKLGGLAGAAALAAPAVVGKAKAADKVSWTMQVLWDPGTTPYSFEERFVARVAELTEGNFEIKLFAAGQIVPAAQMFDAVRGGAFQLMKNFDGYNAGAIPAFAFTSTIPFGYPQSDQFEAWFYEKGGIELAREAYGPAGLYFIAPSVYGQEPIHSRTRIDSVEQMKGLKGRFVGLASTVMAAFGVAVDPLPTAEVYQALERGIVDIADRGDLTANYDAGLGEVAKFILLPGFHQPTTSTSYVANQAAWEALPQAYKAALQVAAREVSSSLRQHNLVNDVAILPKYEAQGVEIVTIADADIKANRPKAAEAWRTATKDDALATRMLDSHLAFMAELGLV